MKSAGKVSVFLAGCAALWLLAALSCVSPVDTGGGPGGAAGSGGGGSGGVTFPLAINGGGARTAVPGNAELQGMTVKVNFTSPGKTAVYREFPISGGEVTLDNGSWNAEVKAYNSEPRLRGIANTSFRVNGSGQVDIRITSAVRVKTAAQLREALDGSGQYYDSDPANGNLILLENDITLASIIPTAPGNFVIAAEPGASRTISRAWGGFVIGRGPGSSGYSLTLGKEGTGTLIVDGLGVDSGTGSALFYADGGRMTIKDGVEIKDVVDNSNGGAAIWVHNGGSLDMRGGNISGCEVPGNSGGAIWVIGAEFTMNGGKISDCEADSGGAISVEGAGGAVYIYSDPSGNGRSVFTMSGGEISGNTAYTGGGVYVFSASPYYSTFTMSGGTISGNTAGLAGGGVYVENQNIFAKRGGTINANSPNEAYSVFGSKTRTTPAGPGVRLYVESDSMANTGNFVDPDGSVDTTSNWQ